MKKILGWLIIILFVATIIGVLIANFGILNTFYTLIVAISLSCLLILALDWITGKDEEKIIIWKRVDK